MSKKINWIIFIIFAVATFLVGLVHEPWFDEAQSWLQARDCGLFEIVFSRCSYEGTPFLFFYILKLFIFFGLSYEYIFVIPWIFTCIGVYLFLFKSDFSTIFRITIPFTFFIFYQYSIIARPYCLFFPTLCLIAIFYQKRYERPFLYCGLLAFLAGTHAYGYVISLILLFFLISDEVLKYIGNSNSSPIHPFTLSPQKIIPIIFLVCYLAFVAFTCMKNPDCDFVQMNLFLDGDPVTKLIKALLRGYFNINSLFAYLSATILVPFLYYLSLRTFCVNKRQVIYFITLNFGVYAALVFVNFYDWHLGIIPFTLIFSIWVLKDVNDIKLSFRTDAIFYIVCLAVICTQIFFSAKNSYLEFYKEYDGAKTVANYIKQNNFKKDETIGFVTRVCAVQPYFKENIFSNKDTCYYSFSKQGLMDEIEKTKEVLPKAKVFITDEDMLDKVLFKDVFDYLHDNFYEDMVVESDMYIKGVKFLSSTTYHVFRRLNNNL